LSKELGIPMKELMQFLNSVGANVRNHMSTVEDEFVNQARENFAGGSKQPKSLEQGPATVTPVSAGPAAPNVPAASAVSPARKPETPVKNEKPTVVKSDASVVGKKPQGETSGAKSAAQRPKETGGTKIPPKAGTHPQTEAVAGERKEAKADTPQTKGQTQPNDRRPSSGKTQGNNNQPNRNQFRSQQSDRRPATGAQNANNRPAASEHNPARNNKPDAVAGKGNQWPAGTKAAGAQGAPRGNKVPQNRSQEQYTNREREREKLQPPRPQKKPQGPVTNVKSVQLPVSMTVKDFAQLLEIAAGEVIKKLMNLGVMATINQEIDYDTMALIADEFGVEATPAQTEEEKLQVEENEDDPKDLQPRPPVVTIMGHVDHGKTSLLDAIRQTNVTAQEAGGITQHIGAYQVEINERKITFLDTPGHEAFTAMRARGAQATDIAILVVAADDGVMPQTVEALNHAKDANVPIIVAINKIDKPGANPDRIKQELTEYGLVAEEWGGDTIFVQVSAKQRIGIENLLEMILLVADIKGLKANPNRPAKGIIIEAKLDKGRGPVATVLVQNGTLEMGDSIIAGAAAGKVRALINDKGKRVKKATPSTPVEVIGFDELPEAGDILNVVPEERLARQLADKRMQYKREVELQQSQKVTLNDLFSKIKEGTLKEVKIIIKADVQGSVEAIRQSLEKLSNDEVKVKVIHGGVGGIGEGDVMLAAASNAIVVGFNVRPDPMAKRIAEKENVDVRLYRIIYNIIDDVKKAMEGMLEPEFKEVVNGRAEIRAVYKVPKVGNVAGCYVVDGKINRNNEIRLIRDNIVIHEGKIGSLKRFKDDVREVSEGFECGIGIENFNDLKEGDIIEAFYMEEIKRQS